MYPVAIGLVLLLAVAIIGIGGAYLVKPLAIMRSFGLPLPGGGPNTAWWLRLKGVRDTVSGLLLLAFLTWGTPSATGLLLLVQVMIPVGDMMLILAAQGSTRTAFGVHGVTAVVMACTALVLIFHGKL